MKEKLSEYNATGHAINTYRKVWLYGFFIIMVCSTTLGIAYAIKGALSQMAICIGGLIMSGCCFFGMLEYKRIKSLGG